MRARRNFRLINSIRNKSLAQSKLNLGNDKGSQVIMQIINFFLFSRAGVIQPNNQFDINTGNVTCVVNCGPKWRLKLFLIIFKYI
jgi:hypothetical protein